MNLVSLLDVCDIEGGTQPPKETFSYEPKDGYVRMLQIQDFKSDSKAVYIPTTSRMKTCEEDDVLIARYGASLGQIHTGRSGAYNVALVRTVPNTTRLDKRYLYHVLRGNDFQSFLRSVGSRAAQAGFNKEDLARFQFHLPSLPEQRRIAAILDQADALRAKRREALAELDQLTQSIFIEMFGDPRANDRRWSLDRIGSLVSDVRGGAALEPEDFIDQGFPVLHKGAIKPQGQIYLDPNKKTFVGLSYANSKPNSIVDRDYIAVTLRDLVPSGPSVGLSADLRRGPHDAYILAQGAYAFRLDQTRLTPEYFVELSNAPTFRLVLKQNAVGSTQIHIRTPIYLDIKIPVPPLSLQTSFSKKIRSIEVQKATIRSSIAELDSLFSSLQHRAFRGEL